MTTTTANPSSTSSVMDRLRNETTDAHKTAESHPLQRALAMGEMPRDHYARHLSQLFFLHRSLEKHLAAASITTPSVAAVFKDLHRQEAHLAADLAHLGFDVSKDVPNSATAAIIADIDRVAATDPTSLLGFHYVLEGSKNGAKFLSRVVKKSLGFTDEKGTRSMDPYGDAQRAHWEQFKVDMNAVGFTDQQSDRLVAAAKRMFDAIGEIGTAMLATHPLPAPSGLPIVSPHGHPHKQH